MCNKPLLSRVHPSKVLIIEAMQWIDRPMSASELGEVLDGALSSAVVSYHLRSLASQRTDGRNLSSDLAANGG
jgi:hypothetical protein